MKYPNFNVGDVYECGNGHKWVCAVIKTKTESVIDNEGDETDIIYSLGYGLTTEPNNDFPDGMNKSVKIGPDEDNYYFSSKGFISSDDINLGKKLYTLSPNQVIAINLLAIKCRYWKDVYNEVKGSEVEDLIIMGGVYEVFDNNDLVDPNYILVVKDTATTLGGSVSIGYRFDMETGYANKCDVSMTTVNSYKCIGVLHPDWWIALWQFTSYGSNEIYIGELESIMKKLSGNETNPNETKKPWYAMQLNKLPVASSNDVSDIFGISD